ncbi:MAG TPA: DUF5675 family protein [Ferruginibacter sp.]|nr:DUF5675 family protein [Ferruginibacter sp.]
MEIELTRTYFKKGTNGMLYYQSSFQCYTIELPWLNNQPQHSCIPEGRYRVIMRYSKKHKTHMQLPQVQDRALILIHPANDALKELKGCIAPVSILIGEGKGSYSRRAFEKVKQLILSLVDEGPIFITIKSNKNEHSRKDTGTNAEVFH